MDFNNIPFTQARWFTDLTNLPDRNPQVIVIHDMEAPDKGNTAENIANYFKQGARKASAHYCIDNNSIVQCVQCRDVAYGAPGMNRHGIHLEHAGYANQTLSIWKDPYNVAMFDLSAQLCGRVLMPKYGIPAVWLTDEEIRAVPNDKTIKGFCTHRDITRALATAGGHTDPGPYFPRDIYEMCVIKYAPTNLISAP